MTKGKIMATATAILLCAGGRSYADFPMYTPDGRECYTSEHASVICAAGTELCPQLVYKCPDGWSMSRSKICTRGEYYSTDTKGYLSTKYGTCDAELVMGETCYTIEQPSSSGLVRCFGCPNKM